MFKDKANEFFASNPDANGVCVTADGTVFDLENWQFADGHAQTLQDSKIEVYAKDENDINDRLRRLFFEGSKWILRLIVDAIIDAIEDKRESKPKKARTK